MEMDAKMPMMAITVSISTKLNPRRVRPDEVRRLFIPFGMAN
jgi:hypothetical protein